MKKPDPTEVEVRAAQFVQAKILMPTVAAIAETGLRALGRTAEADNMEVILEGGEHVKLKAVKLGPPPLPSDATAILKAHEIRRKNMTDEERLKECGLDKVVAMAREKEARGEPLVISPEQRAKLKKAIDGLAGLRQSAPRIDNEGDVS